MIDIVAGNMTENKIPMQWDVLTILRFPCGDCDNADSLTGGWWLVNYMHSVELEMIQLSF